MDPQTISADFTVERLRKLLRKKGLSAIGRKSELVSRVQQHNLVNMADLSMRHRHTSENNALPASDNNGVASSPSTSSPSSSSPSSSSPPDPSPLDQASSSFRTGLEMEKAEREALVLWKRPLTTLQYGLLELWVIFTNFAKRLFGMRKLVAVFFLLFSIAAISYKIDGPHQSVIEVIESKVLWWSYWVGLGILSSVGLGTGLHTFILYLGPHIAMVTMAAHECRSVDFPEPPYPSQVVCPDRPSGQEITIWAIMSKVRVEAFMWGAGTALGELPPYFMARAHRLAETVLDNEDEFGEIEELIHEKEEHGAVSFLGRAKLYMHNLVQRVGFFGILACASIPNPLFDLAGITCGHFLVPFWTFFGATLIGKAIIKMHLQKLFVIFLFSVHHVEYLIQLLGSLPWVGDKLQNPFREWLQTEKTKLHRRGAESLASEEGGSLLACIFEKVVMAMIFYFVISIINSSAQSYHRRLCRARRFQEKTGIANYTRIVDKPNKD